MSETSSGHFRELLHKIVSFDLLTELDCYCVDKECWLKNSNLALLRHVVRIHLSEYSQVHL